MTQFLICRNGDVVHILHEDIKLTDIREYLKDLYVKYQTQDIYFRHGNGIWMKPEFKFSVFASGMRPSRCSCFLAPEEDMPPLVRMRLLTGAI